MVEWSSSWLLPGRCCRRVPECPRRGTGSHRLSNRQPMYPSKKKIAIRREAAAKRQAGRCFYCGVLMCRSNPAEFAAKFGLTLSQVAGICCTAEHMTAQQDGGGHSTGNIAAACWLCNQSRHRRSHAPDPATFRQLVGKRVQAGSWHSKQVLEAGLLLGGTDSVSLLRPETG